VSNIGSADINRYLSDYNQVALIHSREGHNAQEP